MGKVKYGVKKNAPELLLGGALITGTACVATTIVAATKAETITRALNSNKEQLTVEIENGLSKEDSKKALMSMYGEATVGYAKKYVIPATLFVATAGLVFASYKIQKNRQVALSSALASATLAYSTLFNKVKMGAEHGLTAQEILDGVEVNQVVNEETGEVTYEKSQGEALGTIYDFRFDKYSTSWEHDKFQNLCTLNAEMNLANDKLNLEGFLFLNDVLVRLGLPRTKAGQVVGWKKYGDGDGYVDFHIVDASTRTDVGYDENAFDLSFNIDGDILTNF